MSVRTKVNRPADLALYYHLAGAVCVQSVQSHSGFAGFAVDKTACSMLGQAGTHGDTHTHTPVVTAKEKNGARDRALWGRKAPEIGSKCSAIVRFRLASVDSGFSVGIAINFCFFSFFGIEHICLPPAFLSCEI